MYKKPVYTIKARILSVVLCVCLLFSQRTGTIFAKAGEEPEVLTQETVTEPVEDSGSNDSDDSGDTNDENVTAPPEDEGGGSDNIVSDGGNDNAAIVAGSAIVGDGGNSVGGEDTDGGNIVENDGTGNTGVPEGEEADGEDTGSPEGEAAVGENPTDSGVEAAEATGAMLPADDSAGTAGENIEGQFTNLNIDVSSAVQSGASSQIALTFAIAGAGGESDFVIPANSLQIRVQVPDYTELLRWPSFDGVEFSTENSPDGDKYVIMTYVEDKQVASGESVDLYFNAKIFPNNITDNGKQATLSAEMLYGGEVLNDPATGSLSPVATVTAIADQFNWSPVVVDIFETDGIAEGGGEVKIPSTSIISPNSRNQLTALRFSYASYPTGNLDLAHVFTQNVTFEDTFVIPVNEIEGHQNKGEPLILVPLNELTSNIQASGGSISNVQRVRLTVDGAEQEYVTMFTVTLPLINRAPANHDIHGGWNNKNWFILPESKINTPAIDLEQHKLIRIKSVIAGTDYSISEDRDNSKVAGTALSAYAVAGGGEADGKILLELINARQSVVAVKIDATTEDGSLTQKNGIQKYNLIGTSASKSTPTVVVPSKNETTTFALADFKAGQLDAVESFKITDKGYSPDEMYPIRIFGGNYKRDVTGQDFAPMPAGSKFDIVLTYRDGGEYTIKDVLFNPGNQTFLDIERFEKDGRVYLARDIEAITFDYSANGPVPKGFMPMNGPQDAPLLEFRLLSQGDLAGDESGKTFKNEAHLEYTYKGESYQVSDFAEVNYVKPGENTVSYNKVCDNLTRPGMPPTVGDVLQFELEINNLSSYEQWYNPRVVDFYDPEYLMPYSESGDINNCADVQFNAAKSANNPYGQITRVRNVTERDAELAAFEAEIYAFGEDRHLELPHLSFDLINKDAAKGQGKSNPVYVTYKMVVVGDLTDMDKFSLYNRFEAYAYLYSPGGSGSGGSGTLSRHYVSGGNITVEAHGDSAKPIANITKTIAGKTYTGEDGEERTSNPGALLLGDYVTYTIKVSNLQPNTTKILTLKNIMDALPNSTVDGVLRKYFEYMGNAKYTIVKSDFTGSPDQVIVSPRDFPTEPVNISGTSAAADRFVFTMPNYPETSTDGIRLASGESVILSFDAKLVALPVMTATDIVKNIPTDNYAYAFFRQTVDEYNIVSGSTRYAEKDNKNKYSSSTPNYDADDETKSSMRAAVKATVLQSHTNRGDIVKTVSTTTPLNLSLSANSRVRTYTVKIYNYGQDNMTIDKLVDVLPEFESYVPGSVRLTGYLPNTGTVDSGEKSLIIPDPVESFIDSDDSNGLYKEFETGAVRRKLTFTNFALNGSTTEGSASPYVLGSGHDPAVYRTSPYKLMAITYKTQITDVDKEKAVKYLERLDTANLPNPDHNYAAMYLADNGQMTLYHGSSASSIKGSEVIENAQNGDWDDDETTTRRYQSDATVNIAAPKIIPTVQIDALFIGRDAGGSPTYNTYKAGDVIYPAQDVGWEVTVKNNNASSAMVNPKLYVTLPGNISKISDNVVSATFNGAAKNLNFTKQKTGDVWVLEFDLNGYTFNASKSDTLVFRITSATPAGNVYGMVRAYAYLKPGESFFASDLAAYSSICANIKGDLSANLGAPTGETAHYVTDDAHVDVIGLVAAVPKKTIAELNDDYTVKDSANSQNSNDAAPRTITVPAITTPFRYTLELENRSGSVAYKNLTLIDRLPSDGYKTDFTTADHSPRYSESAVKLASNEGNFRVWITDNATGNQIGGDLVNSVDYRLDFSTSTDSPAFNQGDWNQDNTASPNGDWTQDVSNKQNVTAIRISLINGRTLNPGNCIKVSFDASFIPERTQSGKTAFNSFGYGINAGLASSDAVLIGEPYKVGVTTSFEQVIINKKLVTGETEIDEAARTFNFQLYKVMGGQKEKVGEEFPITVTYDQSKKQWLGSHTSTGLKPLESGWSYQIEEELPQDSIYKLDGENSDKQFTVTEQNESKIYEITVVNKAEITVGGEITKTLSKALEEEARTFEFELYDRNDPAEKKIGDTIQVEMLKGDTSKTQTIEQPLSAGIDYGIREINYGDYKPVIPVPKPDTSVPNHISWEFKAENIAKTAKAELVKILELDTGEQPGDSSFTFKLQKYGDSGWEDVDTPVMATFSKAPQDGTYTSDTMYFYDLDASGSYRVVEANAVMNWDENAADVMNAEGYIAAADGENKEYTVVYGLDTETDDTANVKTYKFTYKNTKVPDKAYGVIEKTVKLNGFDKPSNASFTFELINADTGEVTSEIVVGEAHLKSKSADEWVYATDKFELDTGTNYKAREKNTGSYLALGSDNTPLQDGIILPADGGYKNNEKIWIFAATNVERTARAQITKKLVTNGANLTDKTFEFTLYEQGDEAKTPVASAKVTLGEADGWEKTVTFNKAGDESQPAALDPAKTYYASEIGVGENGIILADGVIFQNTYLGRTGEDADASTNTVTWTFTHVNTARHAEGRIVKILNETELKNGAPKNTVFTIALYEGASPTGKLVDNYTLTVANKDGKWQAQTDMIPLNYDKEYYVEEVSASSYIDRVTGKLTDYAVKTAADFALSEDKTHKQWTFTVTNTLKESTAEIVKYLEISGGIPMRTSFDFVLTGRDQNGVVKSTEHYPLTVKRDDNNKWIATTGTIDVDPALVYSVEESGRSQLETEGYTVKYTPVYENVGNHQRWVFTYVNTEPGARTAIASIHKILRTDYENPRRNFTFDLYEIKDGARKLFGSYELTVVQTGADYYENTTLQINGLDPDASYEVAERDEEALLRLDYTIETRGGYTEDGDSIKRWVFTVTNTRYKPEESDSGGSGSGGSGVGGLRRDTGGISLTSIIDSMVPRSDTGLVEITDTDVPLTSIPESSVPLAALPKTGRTAAAMLASMGLLLMGVAIAFGKQKEE